MTAALALKRTDATGTAACTLAGHEALLDSLGVMVLPGLDILVVSDLHLEKGSSLATRNRLIPPYDTRATLARLGAAIAAYRPAMVISLGDNFHDEDGHARLAPDDRAALLGLMKGRDWVWISGNHDPAGPDTLGGMQAREFAIAGLVFRHEPQRGAHDGEVAGHLHPGARVVLSGRSIRRPCFASDGRRMVMPAFGAYTGCLNIRDDAYRTLFARADLVAYMLGKGRVHALPARFLHRD